MCEKTMSEYVKKTLSELVKELERQKTNRYDIVVPTDQLKLGVDLGTNTIYMDVPQINNMPNKKHGLTRYAHEQLATKCQIPQRYYDKMREENKLDLLAKNVNTWLPDREKRLIRVLDDQVRAVLSDRYRIIDNYDMLFQSLTEFKKLQETGLTINIKESSLTDRHLYLKVTSPDLSGRVMHYKDKEEPVEGGIIISNSEVGCGAFRVEPFINVLVCQNGLIGEHKIAKVHLGKERGIGLIDWSDQTLEYQDMALWSEITDLIHSTFDPVIFKQWLNKINDVAGIEIQKPTLAVDNIIKKYAIPQTIKEDLINQFMKESPTVWGLSMAVTRVAQQQENYEKQIDLERIGNQIIESYEVVRTE